jgi:hypothetical protein
MNNYSIGQRPPQVPIEYTCRGSCGTVRRRIEVPERHEKEDFASWLNTTASVFTTADHAREHPTCRATKFDLYMPIYPEKHLGAAE